MNEVWPLQRLAAKAVGSCFKNGRHDGIKHLRRMHFPRRLILRVTRFIELDCCEWLRYMEIKWAHPNRIIPRAKYYTKLYGPGDDFTELSDSDD
jgi:hypothetical protein